MFHIGRQVYMVYVYYLIFYYIIFLTIILYYILLIKTSQTMFIVQEVYAKRIIRYVIVGCFLYYLDRRPRSRGEGIQRKYNNLMNIIILLLLLYCVTTTQICKTTIDVSRLYEFFMRSSWHNARIYNIQIGAILSTNPRNICLRNLIIYGII